MLGLDLNSLPMSSDVQFKKALERLTAKCIEQKLSIISKAAEIADPNIASSFI